MNMESMETISKASDLASHIDSARVSLLEEDSSCDSAVTLQHANSLHGYSWVWLVWKVGDQ